MSERADVEPITAEIVGGLGNQLFIYACARAVATRVNSPLRFDVSLLAQPAAGETPRLLALDWLIEADQILPVTARTPSSRLIAKLKRSLALPESAQNFRERGFGYDSRIRQVKAGTRLFGYFQSWRYFDDIASPLRAELLAKAPRSDWGRAEESLLAGLGDWTAVHIRRGDYTKPVNADHHGLLDADYYERAIEQMRTRNASSTLVIFSDDPSAAQSLLAHVDARMHFVEPADTSHAMESVLLMSKASAVVMANSSFSWWGAWLADPTSTPALAPTPWFKQALSDADIYYPSWSLLDSRFR